MFQHSQPRLNDKTLRQHYSHMAAVHVLWAAAATTACVSAVLGRITLLYT
jgi:hypothetical protein